MSFKDRFLKNSNDYGEFWPVYPLRLFVYLAGVYDERKVAWDCTTGSGQAVISLSKKYSTARATDVNRKC
jgi:hypothetical protein